MNFKQLRQAMGNNRPAGMFDSMPFAIEVNDELKVMWFVYEIESNTSGIMLTIRKIYTIDNEDRLKIHLNPNLKLMLSDIDEDDDFANVNQHLTEDSYWQEFKSAFKNGNRKKLDKLLKSYESKSSIHIYEAVRDYEKS